MWRCDLHFRVEARHWSIDPVQTCLTKQWTLSSKYLLQRLAMICCSVKGGRLCQRQIAAPLSKKRKDGIPVKVWESVIVFSLVYFVLLGWSRRPESVIVFGLVYFVLLGWSRRPGEFDRIWFGLFCAAWLIEEAHRTWSYLVWFILCCMVDREGRESVIVFCLV